VAAGVEAIEAGAGSGESAGSTTGSHAKISTYKNNMFNIKGLNLKVHEISVKRLAQKAIFRYICDHDETSRT
jgi:hypothetical protein